ncbi:MAG: hypothetical protein ACLVAW_19900 [Eisenbergiella massiliensis]
MAVAGQLGIPPRACLVFEDIIPELAGKAAGMKVCAVEDAYSLDQAEEKRRLPIIISVIFRKFYR